MSQTTSLSFLSKFDPSEFYELAKDLPSSLEIQDQSEVNSNDIPNNIEIIGTHLLVPGNSISEMINSCMNTNNLEDTTIIDFEALSNIPLIEDSIPTSNLPSIEKFSGPYDFKLNIQSSDSPAKKTASWTYSRKLNKLYCNPNVACPIDISVSNFPITGCNIRAMPVYSKYEHIHQVITRCENHKKSKEFDKDVILPEQALAHFIRCRHPQATYNQDLITSRQSVVIPFERPQTGSSYTTVLFQFMCYSSCIGGSQKPVKIVINLEYNDQILGRDSFEVKICACPGRDRSADENKMNKKNSIFKEKVDIKNIESNKNGILKEPETNTKLIKIKSICLPEQENDEEIFTLSVKGRKNFEILKNLNDALELQTLYAKLKRKNTNELNITEENKVKLLKNGSFMFKNNNSQSIKQSEKSSTNKITTLENFLEMIEMSAYYNIIVSKGINSLNDLVESNKKRINSLRISSAETDKLWNAIQKLKKERESSQISDNENVRKKLKYNKSIGSINDLFNFDESNQANQTNKYIKLSKYQIKYSFGLKNNPK